MNNKETKNIEIENNIQDKEKTSSNPFPIINKSQSEIKEDYNLVIQNYEMANLKSASKIYKHSEPSK